MYRTIDFIENVDTGVRGGIDQRERHKWSRSRERVHGVEAARKKRDREIRQARAMREEHKRKRWDGIGFAA